MSSYEKRDAAGMFLDWIMAISCIAMMLYCLAIFASAVFVDWEKINDCAYLLTEADLYSYANEEDKAEETYAKHDDEC